MVCDQHRRWKCVHLVINSHTHPCSIKREKPPFSHTLAFDTPMSILHGLKHNSARTSCFKTSSAAKIAARRFYFRQVCIKVLHRFHDLVRLQRSSFVSSGMRSKIFHVPRKGLDRIQQLLHHGQKKVFFQSWKGTLGSGNQSLNLSLSVVTCVYLYLSVSVSVSFSDSLSLQPRVGEILISNVAFMRSKESQHIEVQALLFWFFFKRRLACW